MKADYICGVFVGNMGSMGYKIARIHAFENHIYPQQLFSDQKCTTVPNNIAFLAPPSSTVHITLRRDQGELPHKAIGSAGTFVSNEGINYF